MKRREFLAGTFGALSGLATWGHVRSAAAIGPDSDIVLGRLLYPGSTPSRKSSLRLLADEVRAQTSVDCALETPDVTFKSSLFSYPLLFAICDRSRGNLPERQGIALQEWLSAGGTLIVDNVGTTGPSEGFDEQFRLDMKKLFPRNPMRKIPADHVLYGSFYRLDYPAGRKIIRSYLEGIEIDGRLAVIYSQNDFSGAWARGPLGRWEYDVIPGGERQRNAAIRLGINFVEYALCQDYKADQVHVDYLLKKRKWKPSRTQALPQGK